MEGVQSSEKIVDFEEWFLKQKHLDKNDWDYINSPSCKGMYKVFYKKYCKDTAPVSTTWLWLTLSPDKLKRNIDNTPENREKLYNWCEKWFKFQLKFYGNYKWIIESGSKNDHLHVHFLGELKKSKNHADRLKKSWAKTFPSNKLLTTVNLVDSTKRGEYAYAVIKKKNIMLDKLDYFDNEKKGEHSNALDLGLEGSRGLLSDK